MLIQKNEDWEERIVEYFKDFHTYSSLERNRCVYMLSMNVKCCQENIPGHEKVFPEHNKENTNARPLKNARGNNKDKMTEAFI